MPLKKVMKSVPTDILAAEGIFQQDLEALTPCQRECVNRLAMTIQLEQEAYLSAHPEVMAMMELFISDVTGKMKRKSEIIKDAADFFLRPVEDIDREIRNRLGIGPEGPYIKPDKPVFYFYDDETLLNDLLCIVSKHFPPPAWSTKSSTPPMPHTASSSFISIKTSDTTLPTPEPVPIPPPTVSENMLALVSNAVDKAIFQHVDDAALLYDTAYVELAKAVEEAMEIPVIEIREDIAELFYKAYKYFEINIMEKERIAAEIAWEKRMRKKMKRTVRRRDNFKGFETPPTPKSTISSHESYRKPPPRPCICHPQWQYNRYKKDRFGIYLPSEKEYTDINVTATPVISMESIQEEATADDVTSRTSRTSRTSKVSKISRKSAASTKSGVSQKKTIQYTK